MAQTPTRARRRRPAPPMPSLSDASFVRDALLAGLRPDPRPQEDEDGQPHKGPYQTIAAHGEIEIIERDAQTGAILSHFHGPNLIVNTGLDLIAKRISGRSDSDPPPDDDPKKPPSLRISGVSQYALGTDSTPPVAANTALLVEAYRGTLKATRVLGPELEMTLFLGSTEGNGHTYVEGGAFNAEGTMLCRAIFPAKAKTSAKTLTVIHTIPLDAG
jgi:hypothetical protein